MISYGQTAVRITSGLLVLSLKWSCDQEANCILKLRKKYKCWFLIVLLLGVAGEDTIEGGGGGGACLWSPD